MLSFKHKGDYSKTTNFLKSMMTVNDRLTSILEKYGEQGVVALSSATPKETGLTAGSWYYKIEKSNGSSKIVFCNSNIQNGVPIAIIIQYGHGTGNGGWVEGQDYINPALRPIFDELANNAWKEVIKP